MSNESRTQALDDLDCMLTQFESSFDKENIAKKETIVESNSPLLANNLPKQRYKSKNSSLLLLHKKSKSLLNVTNSCSTPKLNSLEKEIEYLNVLNETGLLNDSVHESPKLVSPIIRCTGPLSSQNFLTSSNESINTPTTNNIIGGSLLNVEGLNRKIKFDEETCSETGSQKDKKLNKLDTVDEDDEILAFVNENELKKSKPDDDKKLEISGFKTASGKDLVYKKENVIKVDKRDPEGTDRPKVEISGFQTASGKSLIYNKEKVLKNDDENSNGIEVSGFQTASGKSLLYKKEKVLKDESSKTEVENELSGFETANGKSLVFKTDDSKIMDTGLQELSGFKTASGKNLLYKKDLVLRNDDLNIPMDCEHKSNSCVEQSGFKTASGKSLLYKKDLILKDNDLISSDTKSNSNLEVSGFQTASGKGLLFKKELVLKDETVDTEPSQVEVSGFKTAGGRNLLYKKDLVLKDDDNQVKDTSLETLGFNTAGGKSILFNKEKIIETEPEIDIKIDQSIKIPIKIEQDQQFKPVLIQKPTPSTNRMMDGKKFKRPQLLDKNKLNKYVDSPSNESKIEVDEKVNESIQENFFTDNQENVSNVHIFKPIANTQISYLKLKDLNFVKTNQNGTSLVRPVFEIVQTKLNYPVNVDSMSWEEKRLLALETLTKRLDSKKQTSLKPGERSKPGYLFDLKKSAKEGQKTVFLKNLTLKKDQIGCKHKLDLDDVRFSLDDYEDLFGEFKSNGFIQTPDSGLLIPDKNLQIGVNELYNCFLDCKGVDSKLVDLVWFKNHLKWVVWKLFCYDKNFTDHLSQTSLTPLNVLNQLKYRYDIEIGNARRSSIRKIIEKDETSMNKSIILFLSKILQSSTSPSLFVELCDGWYPIKAQLDTYLSDYVKRGRIKIGDKLVIFSGELIGCPKDGCAPLEAPEDMFFKISVNSTRKAKWHAKLGFLKPQRPLIVKLNSLKPNSIVGSIDVLIDRIYPIMYMEKRPDGSKVYRNQKQEDILNYSQMKDNENKSINYDGDYDQSIDDGRKGVSDKSLNQSKNGVTRRDVTQILKIRVRDWIKNSPETSCLLTFWQNGSDVYEKMSEGQRFIFFNLSSATQKNMYQDSSSISLGTNRMTFYKSKKAISNDSTRSFCEYKDLYEGKVTNIFNEIDTCGIVVKHSSNNFNTLVYLTNLNQTNSIICIGFPKGPDLNGFKDVLKVSSCVACLNLKFTRKKENLKYPYLVASEFTFFTQKINSYKFLSVHFNQLNELTSKQETKSRLIEMADEIDKQPKSSCPIGNTYENSLNKPGNFKLNTSSTKLNESKENKLASIIEAAETIPLQMKSGMKQPGLVSKPKFFSPIVNRSTDNQNKNQLKRRSDTFVRESMVSFEEDEDSFISNCDLDSLCKSNNSCNASMIISESIAKRIKKS